MWKRVTGDLWLRTLQKLDLDKKGFLLWYVGHLVFDRRDALLIGILFEDFILDAGSVNPDLHGNQHRE